MRKSFFAIFLAAIILLVISTAFAQLIIVDRNLKVVKVDTLKNRIEITGVDEKPDKTRGYVFVDGTTTVLKDDKPFDWKKLEKGWIIRVKGGVRVDTNVNAKKIWVIRM